MAKLRTLFHVLVAGAALASGSNLGGGQPSRAASVAGGPQPVRASAPFVAADPSFDAPALTRLGVGRMTNEGAGLSSLGRLAQIDLDEPLDAPLDGDDEPAGEDPLDAPLADEPVTEPVPDDTPRTPVAEVEPLDAPLDDTVALDPVDDELLDAPLAETPVAAAPVAETPVAVAPVTEARPVVATASAVKPKSQPVSPKPQPVTSVRTKGAPQDQGVVVAGRRPLPAELATCDVAVGAGRATVGSDCESTPVVAGFQPAIPRVPGSSALVTTDNPSLITSRRDGVQIGEYPAPTLGASIATTVRAAIFPEAVVVPDVLIVPGEVTVAGNRSREDPIVLWRSELEEASASSGIPIEMLATVISAAAQGDPTGDAADGRVGIMQVPVAELVARGISEDQWNDPATNIRVGAELLAGGASATELQSGAAVTEYLAGSCTASGSCEQPVVAQDIDALIVYYRLRMTTDAQAEQEPAAGVAQTPGWPFNEEVDPEPAGPFGPPWEDDEQDAEGPPNSPSFPGRTRDDEPEAERPWPFNSAE